MTVGRLAADGLVNLQVALHTVQDAGNTSSGGLSNEVVPLNINEEVIKALIPADKPVNQTQVFNKSLEGRGQHGVLNRPQTLALYSPLPVETFNLAFDALQGEKARVGFGKAEAGSSKVGANPPSFWQRYKKSLLVVGTVTSLLVAALAIYRLTLWNRVAAPSKCPTS